MQEKTLGLTLRDNLNTFANPRLSCIFYKKLLKMKLLLPLFLACLVISCSKKDHDIPADPATFIREITSVKVNDLSVDTTLNSLPPLTGSFPSPESDLVFRNRELYRNAADSLYIAIDHTDSLASVLQFDQAVRIPSIVGEYRWDIIVLDKDSISITSYVSKHTFISYDRLHSNTSQSFTGPVSNYIFKRYYQRIHYTGELKLNVKDNEGNISTLTGRFRSSRVGTPFTDITVY
jgi:hypothetical protein